MATGLVLRIRIDGHREVLAAFRRLPPEANASLRERTLKLSTLLASKARAAAVADSAQSTLIAPTIKARKDRLPSVQAGGMRRVGRNKVPAYKVLFGAEFGATHLEQYRPHVGQGSYWFFRTFDDRAGQIERAWLRVADDVVRAWGGAV